MLYGFDARAPVNAPDALWSEQRRSVYLLRPEVERPLSVDRRVWPPVPAAELTDGFAPDYWADLDALRRKCVEADLAPGDFTLIALGVADETDRERSLLVPCRPSSVQPDWCRLGYDVADTGLTSGLSNAGFLAEVEDVDGLRSSFGSQLGENGLFASPDDADAFRVRCDERLPEHAPFLVHALFVVPL